MYLELAETGMSARPKKRPQTYQVSGYKRSANFVPAHSRRYHLQENDPQDNPYIFVPNFEQGGGLYIREDKFDSMPGNQWNLLMKTLAPYQPQVQQGMSENTFLGNRAERKARRDEKKDQKATNKANREQRKEDKNERKNQRQTARDERKANKKPIDWGGVKDTATSVIGGIFGKKDQGADMVDPIDPNSGGKPFYKNPAVIIGGLAVVGLGIYFATKKKK